MPRYYPIFLDIAGHLCVVIGGGAVAERKATGLIDAGARVRVVCPTATATLQEQANSAQIELCLTEYVSEHLDGARLVFAATNSRSVNQRIAEDAVALGVPVTVADSPDEGSFIVPSVVRRGEFCLAISTGGSNPMLSVRIADEMEARFGPDFGAFVELLGAVRDTIKESTAGIKARRAAAAAVLDHEAQVREHLVEGRPQEAFALALAAAQKAAAASVDDCPSDDDAAR